MVLPNSDILDPNSMVESPERPVQLGRCRNMSVSGVIYCPINFFFLSRDKLINIGEIL